MFTRSLLSLYLLLAITSLIAHASSLRDQLASLKHGPSTLRLNANDEWTADSSEEASNEDQREAYLNQLKNIGNQHHRLGGLPV